MASINKYIKRNKKKLNDFLNMFPNIFVHRFYSIFPWWHIYQFGCIISFEKNHKTRFRKEDKTKLISQNEKLKLFIGIQVTSIMKLEYHGKNRNKRKNYLFDL